MQKNLKTLENNLVPVYETSAGEKVVDLNILDKFCKENNMTRPQGVREAVRKLKEK